MEQVKSLKINKEIILTITQFGGLLALATFVPMFWHNQFVTGPIVNAVLFATVVLLGRESAILVGLIPSVMALSFGLLPPALAPIVPFIMASNAVLVLAFSLFKRVNYWLGVAIASFLKFVFLYFSTFVVLELIVKKELAQNVIMIMSWSQLVTALSGGILAFIFLKKLKRFNN